MGATFLFIKLILHKAVIKGIFHNFIFINVSIHGNLSCEKKDVVSLNALIVKDLCYGTMSSMM